MASLGTQGLTLPVFLIPAKRYQGYRWKGRTTSSLQAEQTLPSSVSFARKVPSKASICASRTGYNSRERRGAKRDEKRKEKKRKTTKKIAWRALPLHKNFRCYAAQTQTLEQKSPTISKSQYAPVKGKTNGPKLDFGGGGPPPNDGSGGGGGGGGGSGSAGGFLLFLFLMLLDYLKELDEKSQRRRHRDVYNQLLV